MRLIDADALYETLCHIWDRTDSEDFEKAVFREIENAPVVEERKTGEWQITDAYPHNVYCSVCHKRFAQTHWEVWEDGSLPRKYCPNCGARME